MSTQDGTFPERKARKQRWDISPNQAFWGVVALLLCCSVYFVVNVELRRSQWQGKKSDPQIASGTQVTVTKIIDGDEVSVKAGTNAFVVRLLGIKAFNSAEPGLSGLGPAAMGAMEQILGGLGETKTKVIIEYDEYKRDRAGRVLAYLRANDRDVGEQLVQGGYVVAYTRYPFSREDRYLGAEQQAISRRLGLWANEKAVSRVSGWKGSWEATRQEQQK